MNVSLTPELEKYISSQVQSGLYGSNSEVIREALRNQIQLNAEKSLEHRVALSRQQAKEGKLRVADAAYFEEKRDYIRSKYSVS